jgi:chromosome segregation ATPase
MVNILISWKHSFRRLSEEHEMTKKKKQAIDNLLNSGKISKSTYELFDREIAEAVAEIEKQQQALLAKMKTKAEELEGEIGTLEMLLANFEIQHVAGEVDEEVYQREASLLSVGLEFARQELTTVRDTANQLLDNEQITPAVSEQQGENANVSRTEVTVVETQPPQTQQQPNEASQNPVEPLPAEVKTGN